AIERPLRKATPMSKYTPRLRCVEVQYSLVRVQTFCQKIRSNLFKLVLAIEGNLPRRKSSGPVNHGWVKRNSQMDWLQSGHQVRIDSAATKIPRVAFEVAMGRHQQSEHPSGKTCIKGFCGENVSRELGSFLPDRFRMSKNMRI